MAAVKQRMNIEEVMADMRSRGMSVSYRTFIESVDKGVFPFVTVLGQSETGRRRQIILRSDYEAWANEKIGG